MGHVVIFEDVGWRRLYPITLSRASFDCRVGVTTLGHRLISQLSRRQYKRVDFLVRTLLRPLVERDYPGHSVNHEISGDVVFLNGRTLCLGDGLEDLLILLEKAVAVQQGGELIGARLSQDAAARFGKEAEAALEAGEPVPFPGDHTVAAAPAGVRLVTYPWELVLYNAEVLEDDFGWIHHPGYQKAPRLEPGAQTLHRERILSRDGVTVEAGAILDAKNGPIILGEGASILHQALVLGPAYIGPQTIVRAGARLLGSVSVGPVCRVGGEIEGSIVHGYANKQHDGFLGHSYLGAWTNLGAGTNNSDLKNNYSTIRMWTPDGEVDTGETFLGLFMGDHSKTAIGTTLNTGSSVGFSCNLFGAGFPPKHLPSFSWWGTQLEPYDLERALAVARTVRLRRQVDTEPADEVVFRAIHEQVGELEA